MANILATIVAKAQMASRNARTIVSIEWKPFGPHYATVTVVHSEVELPTWGKPTLIEKFEFRSL